MPLLSPHEATANRKTMFKQQKVKDSRRYWECRGGSLDIKVPLTFLAPLFVF